MLDIAVKVIETITVVELAGEIDGNTAPGAQARILEQIKAGEGIVLDMTNVTYMSSAGLRMLLSTHRAATGNNARVLLVGLTEDLQDTMAATGFLDFFSTYGTLPAALEALKG